jgi:DNA-binding phage protein
MTKKTLNIKSLIKDCGGVSKVSRETEIPRVSIYRWISSGNISTDNLFKILELNSDINLNKYIEINNDRPHEESLRSSKGVRG